MKSCSFVAFYKLSISTSDMSNFAHLHATENSGFYQGFCWADIASNIHNHFSLKETYLTGAYSSAVGVPSL